MILLPRPSVVGAARALAVIVLVLLAALTVQTCRLSDRDARIAVETATRAGWSASTGRPTIPDLPPHASPRAVVSGGVRYLPVRRRPAPAPNAPLPPGDLAGGGCDLDALTVDLDCRAEIATASGTPMARLWVRGLLADGARSRELPWHRVGDPVTIPMPIGPQPVETAPPVVRIAPVAAPDRWSWGLRRPAAWRTGWVAGVGVSYDPFNGRTAPAAFVGYGVSF